MVRILALTLLAVSRLVISADMDSALAADAECGPGEECALNALQQKAVVAQLQSEDSVEKFAAALEEGDEDAEAEAQSLAQQASDKKWAPPPQYGTPYQNPYGQPIGFNPYGAHYGSNPYSVPGVGVGGCLTKIQGSSCMVFDCARSRGPTRCNLQDYFCYCQPGYCSDGKGCAPQQPTYR